MTMQFQFTARVERLGYSTNDEVEEQAKANLADPDMILMFLQIGTWEEIKHGWETQVVATVDDGRDVGQPPEPGHAVIWPSS